MGREKWNRAPKITKKRSQSSGILQACTQRPGHPERQELKKGILTVLKAESTGVWLRPQSQVHRSAPASPTPGTAADLLGPAWRGNREALRAPFPGWAVCQLGLGAGSNLIFTAHPDCPPKNHSMPSTWPDSSQPITYCITSTQVNQHN